MTSFSNLVPSDKEDEEQLDLQSLSLYHPFSLQLSASTASSILFRSPSDLAAVREKVFHLAESVWWNA